MMRSADTAKCKIQTKQKYYSGVKHILSSQTRPVNSVDELVASAVLQKSFAQMWAKRVEDDQPYIS